MKDAESRFAISPQSPATGGGVSSWCAVARLTLFGALIAGVIAIAPAAASAEYLHGPVNYEFGPTGGAGSFGTINTLAYQQATKRLYVLGDSSINGFSNPSPGTFTPLGGNFPIAVGSDSNDSDIAVDNSAGASAGHVFWGPDGNEIKGWDSSGNALAGFPINTENENCGIAVDNEGHIWGGRYGSSTAAEWGPGGGSLLQSISVGSAVGNPCKLTVDLATNDLWVSQFSEAKVAKFPAAGGYSTFTSLSGLDEQNNRIAINATRHVAYVGGPNASSIRVYRTTTGELLESFNVTGGTVKGIAVQDSTDTVFVAVSDGTVQELPGLSVPKATTGEPTANSTVSGTADPDGTGEITECFFEFGLTDSGATPYGSTMPCDQSLPITSTTPVSATLSLIGENTYHYRLVLGNANGRNHGADRTITPHNVKNLETDGTTGVSRTEATIEGHYEGDNNETHYHFEWGLSGATPYEHSTPDEVKPAGVGNTPLSASLVGLTGGTTYHYRIVATNSFGESDGADRTFMTSPAIKHLATNPADEINPTTALLHGELDPDGLNTTFYFQYGHTTGYGLSVPTPPGAAVGTTAPGDTPVSAEVTGLDPGTTYHYRIVGVNSTGLTAASDDQTFDTPQPPSIESFTSRKVTADSAELVAQINPNEAGTEYHFEYGTSPSYGSVAPIPEGTIDSGAAAEEVEVSLNGLESTTYHFRVVAHSKWGTTTTGDQTFNFAAPACPNAQLRAQTGSAFLPDCRGYELVTPPNAANIFLQAEGPYGPSATGPSRLAFTGSFGYIEGTGEPQANTDLYVATRHSNGWQTRYVGLPGSEKNASAGPPKEPGETIETAGSFERTNGILANPDLSKFLVWDPGVNTFDPTDPKGSDAPYVLNDEGAVLGRLPSNVDQIPHGTADITEGGYIGDAAVSADFSHYVFSAREMAFSPNGLSASPGSAYDDNVGTGAVTKVSETPQNSDIPAGVGGPNEYVEIPGVSTDGSHILMSTRGPSGTVHLYMTVDDTKHYDVSVGKDGLNHPVKYVGMSANGSTVYFTSVEPLTEDDHDGSVDLFMWTDTDPTAVTRVSTGDGGTGNTDSCSAGWTQNCDIAPISTEFRSDNAIAGQTGEIYFYSPEQLDHGRGVLNARNLYVFSQGQIHFVTTMPEADPITRIQVSPTGDHLALVTAARLSASPTGGYREMYILEPDGGFHCVSCSPSGAAPAFEVEGSKNGLFMTDDGRAFFSTAQSLVNQDTDGIVDTYEFVDNRPQLISSGTAANTTEGTGYPYGEDTGLIGVSADGTDVYFGTRDTMVEQDTVGPFLKFYDARTNGGIPFKLPTAPCAAADECHGPASTAPATIASSTGEQLGSGGNHPLRGVKHHKKKHRGLKNHQKRHGHGHRREARSRG